MAVYCNGVTSARGVKCGHMSAVSAHNWISCDTMTKAVNSGVTVKGNNRNNTCNGAYKGSLNVGAETRGDDDIEKSLRNMIPDGLIGRFLLEPHSTRHRITLMTVKPLLSSKLRRLLP
jgi:hypothetical protein